MSSPSAAAVKMSEPAAHFYRAFISYSHADTAWAKWLQRGLESFKIDKGPGRTGDGARRHPRNTPPDLPRP